MIRFILFLLPFHLMAQAFTPTEVARWKKQAQNVTILRDTWGVPHVYGKTDADVVFGLLYVQCEDDFPRVEDNYLTAIGRLAEVNGETDLYTDLVTRMLSDTTVAMKRYVESPANMKKLFDAFAGGINYYLYTHPEIKPRLIKRFQPWMPLLFPEGSIGGNRSSISLDRLKGFYSGETTTGSIADPQEEASSKGSNGFAIAPSHTVAGNGLLLINPHTSFYFRSEVHGVSDEGLNAYGAVTWGQFFIYQGFNTNCGWMHTSAQADAVDEYAETIVKRGDSTFYQYDGKLRPIRSQKISIGYRSEGGIKQKEFIVYRTHHGPVVGKQGDRWITFKMLDDPLAAITQSYMRTRSADMATFKKWMELKTNTSNGTTYVDNKGNIAYWHGNFIPRRDPQYDWSKPVDGSTSATEWKGLHDVDELVQIINPPNGWIQNCNSTPFTGAGPNSPDKTKYPAYMAPDAETPRAVNAVRLLSHENRFTLDKLITTAYDTYLSAFEVLLPPLIKGFDSSSDQFFKMRMKEPIELLRSWDKRSSASSEATTLAITWASKFRGQSRLPNQQLVDNASPQQMFDALHQAVQELQDNFGSWKVAWGEVNRYQRLTGNIKESYDDQKPSLGVGLASGAYGSLPSFASQTFPGTKRRYGTVGNSFVCVVEFGKKVKAKSIVTGGQSSDPASKHFTDQAEMFCTGKFKDVLFYKEDVEKHVARKYKPGERGIK
jgi:acyl-homoserine lactone acylase PvdQ